MKNIVVAGFLLLQISFSCFADEKITLTPSSPNTTAYIIEPKNGATVNTTFSVSFGLKGMGVAPAGIDKENTGHHHLLIDTEQLPDPKHAMGSNVQHFGGGQTETTLTLSPGAHTLQLILGDYRHVPHQPPIVSEKITITVVAANKQ